MNSRSFIITAAVLAAVLFVFCGTGAASADYVDGQIFVCYADDTIPNQDLIIRDFSSLVHGLYLIKTEGSVEDAVTYYSALQNVRYAEPNYIVSISKVPNDARYAELWNMQNAQAESAWDITTGSYDVVVAVIDTGINYNHEDLKDNIWTDENGNHGYNFVNNTPDPMDDHGHGTHCAGTIGAKGDNKIGVAGMAWDVKLMAVKSMNMNGQGTSDAIISGIQYAADNGAKVISMSLGSVGVSQAETEVIRAVSDKAVIVAAAGNEASNNDIMTRHPANTVSKNSISVAAIDKDNSLAVFSNYGIHNVDVAAPGVDILSAAHNDNSGYVPMSGTSMATPLVSGIAALMYAVNETLAPFEVVGIIKKTVDPIDSLDGKIATGGKVNAASAVRTVKNNLFHDVIFDSKGGSEVYPAIALSDKTVDIPVKPVKSGYDFDGWYTSSNVEWNFADPVTETMTLYAHWTEKPAAESHYSTHESIETPWTETTSLPTESGKYYLTHDVYLSDTWEVNNDITLCLNGQTISGEPVYAPLIRVTENGSFTLCDCTNQGTISGYAINGEYPMHNDEQALLMTVDSAPQKPTYTQGIAVMGKFTLNSGTLTDFTAPFAGGAVCVSGGTFVMNGGTITKSSGNDGGGVAVAGDGAVFIMNGGTITNCSANSGGGVNIEDSTFTMNGGSITRCTAAMGGGIYVSGDNSKITIKSEIKECSASMIGGGIFLSQGCCTLSDGKIIGCTVKGSGNIEYGGAVCFDVQKLQNHASFEMNGNAEISDCHAIALNTAEIITSGGIYGTTASEITLRDNAKVHDCTLKLYKNGMLYEEIPEAISTSGKLSVYDNASVENLQCLVNPGILTNSSFTGEVNTICPSLTDAAGQLSSLQEIPLIQVAGGNAESIKSRFTISKNQSGIFTLEADDTNTGLYLKPTGFYEPEEFDVTVTELGDKTKIETPDDGNAKILTLGGDTIYLFRKDAVVGTGMMLMTYQMSGIGVYAGVRFTEIIPSDKYTMYKNSVEGTVESAVIKYPFLLLETPAVSGTMDVTPSLSVTKVGNTLPSFSTAFDKTAAAKIRAYTPGAIPVSVLSASGDADMINTVKTTSLLYSTSSDMHIPENMKAAVYQIDNTEIIPLTVTENNGMFDVSGTGLSTYVFAFIPENPRPPHTTTISSSDTGSGNYAEYPRTVTNGGHVDFGTSRVVKGVTLPDGISGSVVLVAKSTQPAPEGMNVHSVFEINIPSYPEGKESVIEFQFAASVIENAGYTPADIVLCHLGTDGWEEVPTTYSMKGSTVYYKAKTTSFSPFAICYSQDAAKPEEQIMAAQMYSSEKIIIKIDESRITVLDLPEGYEYVSLGGLGLYTASVPAGKTVEETIQFFSGVEGVLYAEPDGYVYLNSVSEPAAIPDGVETSDAVETEIPPAKTNVPGSPMPFAGIAAGLVAGWILVRKRG